MGVNDYNQEIIDSILDKITHSGINSLTDRERKILANPDDPLPEEPKKPFIIVPGHSIRDIPLTDDEEILEVSVLLYLQDTFGEILSIFSTSKANYYMKKLFCQKGEHIMTLFEYKDGTVELYLGTLITKELKTNFPDYVEIFKTFKPIERWLEISGITITISRESIFFKASED